MCVCVCVCVYVCVCACAVCVDVCVRFIHPFIHSFIHYTCVCVRARVCLINRQTVRQNRSPSCDQLRIHMSHTDIHRMFGISVRNARYRCKGTCSLADLVIFHWSVHLGIGRCGVQYANLCDLRHFLPVQSGICICE